MAPTPQMWERLEAALAERRRKRRLAWFRMASAAAVLLVTSGSLAWLTWGSPQFSSPPDAQLTLAGHRTLLAPVALRPVSQPVAPAAGGDHQATPLSGGVVSPSLQNIAPQPAPSAPVLAYIQAQLAPFSAAAHVYELQGLPETIAEAPAASRRKEKTFEFSSDEPAGRAARNRRFAIGGTYSPDLALATSHPGDVLASSSAKASNVDAPAPVQADPTSFTSGLRFSYGMTEHLDLYSGFLYSNRKGVSDQAGTFSTSYAYEQAAVVETQHLYQAFEVPVGVKVNLKPEAKVNPYVATGLSGNFFYRYRAAAQTESDKVNYKQVNNLVPNRLVPSQLNVLVGAGVQYRAAEKVSMHLEPGLRYGLVTTDYSFSRTLPLTAGVNAGVNLHF